MRAWLAICVALPLAGCQTANQHALLAKATVLDPRKIVVTSDRSVDGACHLLGREQVWAGGRRTGDGAVAGMREKAAQLHGNLVVSDGPVSVIPGSLVTMWGDIFLC